MADPIFGVQITQVDNEPRPAVAADLSTIGLVITAENADTDAFPADTPVLVNSNDPQVLIDLGAGGTVEHQIGLINAQLTDFAASASIVIVRVAEGIDDDATTTNLIAGLEKLKEAPALLGVTPRLIGVPGFTHQQENSETANPVCAALPAVCEALQAHAVVTGPHTTLQEVTDWKETISSDRLIPVETWVKVGTNPDTVDSVGAILGLAVARDNANGGVPSSSWANRAIQGIVGINRAIPYSITDGNTEGQLILAQNVGIIVKGESGSATSLSDSGFVFIGTDTASADSLWQFYNVTRMRDYIHLMFLRTLRIFLGRFNLTGQTIQAILNTMEGALSELEADNHILGSNVGFREDDNTPENLRLGQFTVYFEAEEPPVLRKLDIKSYRYRAALDALVDDLIGNAA